MCYTYKISGNLFHLRRLAWDKCVPIRCRKPCTLMNQRMAECLAVIVFSLNSLLCCDTFKTIELTDTAIPVSLISKIKESKLSVYSERNDVTPSPNDLACWLFLLFIFPTCLFQSRICLWEMFIDLDASRRDKPLSTFCRITHKYMSFSCSVNLLTEKYP